MKQILSSVLILLLLMLLSISDFSLGEFPDSSQTVAEFDSSQHDCLDYELPDRVLDGSDSSCYAAAMYMQQALDRYGVNCLYITNDGWIPTAKNPVNRQWVKYLLSEDGGFDLDWRSKGGD